MTEHQNKTFIKEIVCITCLFYCPHYKEIWKLKITFIFLHSSSLAMNLMHYSHLRLELLIEFG